MEIEYRRFSKNDLWNLFTLSDDEWKGIHIELVKSLLQAEGNIEQCFVAISDDKLAGYIYGFALPNGTLIPEFLYVLPEYRKHGIGKRLLCTLEENSGCCVSIIYYNNTLHDYYEKLGYSSGSNLEVAMKNIAASKG